MLRLMNSAAANDESVGDFMRDVDRTLLRENLKLSFEERARKHLRVLQMVEELRLGDRRRHRGIQTLEARHVYTLVLPVALSVFGCGSDVDVKVTQPSWLFGRASIRACEGCKMGSRSTASGKIPELRAARRAQIFSATRAC